MAVEQHELAQLAFERFTRSLNMASSVVGVTLQTIAGTFVVGINPERNGRQQ